MSVILFTMSDMKWNGNNTSEGLLGGHSTVLFPFTVITAILLKWSTLDMVAYCGDKEGCHCSDAIPLSNCIIVGIMLM